MGFNTGEGSGSTRLSGSNDVAFNTLDDNNTLTYDSSIDKWRNAPQASIIADSTRFTGIYKGDLTKDSSLGFGLALNAVPDGGTLLIPPGTYRYDATLFTVTNKSVRFCAYGATFIKYDKAGSALQATFDMEPTIAVATITPATNPVTYQITPGIYTTYSSKVGTPRQVISTNPCVKIKLTTQPPSWRRGEIIKIFAFDVNPDARDEDANGNASRSGQQLEFIEIDSSDSSGKTIICIGVLRDTYLLSPRVAKYSMGTIHWEGGTFGISDDVFNDGLAQSQLMRIQSAHMPVIKDVNIRRQNSMCFQIVDCISPLIDNVDVRFARNDPVQIDGTNAYRLGYGVMNGQSENMIVRNSHFSDCRHGYTDDSYAIKATLREDYSSTLDYSPVYKYGRAFNAKIVDSTAMNCTAAAWNTHHGGDQTLFINCTVIASKTAFGARSKNFMINGGIVRDCNRAITTYNDHDNGRGGETYSFIVDGLNINGVDEVWVHDPNASVGGRDLRLSYMRNVHATNIHQRILGVVNASMQIENSYFELAPDYDSTVDSALITVNGLFRMDNSHLSTERVSTMGASSPAVAVLDFAPLGTNEAQLYNVRISNKVDQIASLVKSSNTTSLLMADVKMDYLPARLDGLYVPTTISVSSWIKLQGVKDGKSNANFVITGPQNVNGNLVEGTLTNGVGALALSLSAWEVINIEVNVNATMPDVTSKLSNLKLPARTGQMIYMTNTGTLQFIIDKTNNLFVPLTYNNQNINPGETITMFIDSGLNYHQRGVVS